MINRIGFLVLLGCVIIKVSAQNYSVYLADVDVTTEIAPTERAAIFRFTFPDSKNSYVVTNVFDRGSYIKIIPEEIRKKTVMLLIWS